MSRALSALVLLAILALGLMTLLLGHPLGLGTYLPTTSQAAVSGTWSADFEKAFNRSLFFYERNKAIWARLELRVYGQGRKGVVLGEQGWLFSDEELSCPHNPERVWQQRVHDVTAARNQLLDRGVRLIPLVIPAKIRVYPDKIPMFAARLPSCRLDLYSRTRELVQSPIDLLSLYRDAQDKLVFLKTDTHWTPYGAQIAAQEIARVLAPSPLPAQAYVTHAQPEESYSGDLLRYLPGVNWSLDKLERQKTEGMGELGLLDEPPEPQVVLIGTSYSANPNWNFDGALRQALQADVLNKADEGQGPFRTMHAYLDQMATSTNLPKLVIWEIPERYMMLEGY
jgi:alginate O-acetyltransferase complex protein AlgJ